MKQIRLEHAEANILTRMVRDYLTTAPCLDGYYKYPFDINAFGQIIQDKQADHTNRQLLVQVLQKQYQPIGLEGEVKANVELLAHANTFTVTTAHQPNIFTGYLFFVYKILSTINIAEQLRQLHPQHNFVPIYWMGSEDHDFEEISTINLFGDKLQWQHPSGGPVGRLDTAGLDLLIDAIEEKLGGAPHGAALVVLLRKAYLEQPTLAQATRYLVHQLFAEYGLVIVDQDDPQLKQLFLPVLKDEVSNGRVSGMVQATIDFINQCNYRIQANPREINCFYLGTGSRERIVFEEATGNYHILNTSVTMGKAELLADMDAHPENYSPNVFLRPLYQETILPNLAYVGGGGELSYWLELKALFDYYKINYPMLVLRSTNGILDANAQRKLEKLGIDIKDLFKDEDTLLKDYVLQNTNNNLQLTKEKEQLTAIFDEVMAKARLVDVTLEKAVEGQRQSVLNSLETLEGKLLRAEKRNFETATSQLKALKGKLFPNGSPQERVDNFLPYYAAKGPAWIAEIKPFCNPFTKQFNVLMEE